MTIETLKRMQSELYEEEGDDEDNLEGIMKKQSQMTTRLLQLASPIIDKVPNLVDMYKLKERYFKSPLLGENVKRSIFGGAGFLPKNAFLDENAFLVARRELQTMKDVLNSLKFIKAGPREFIFFNPKKVRAAIVTCGGLCPGLNVVIREIVMSLHFNYEVPEIWGIHWGYKGFYTDIENNWERLTPSKVKGIHKQGGTILGSSRGGFDADKILEALQKKKINQVYLIGGDGTHRGMAALVEKALEKKILVSFAGIPKTIDNDIPIIDYSFGYHTACQIAENMIEAAYTEATSAINGVGLVKLMGRYSGFIARNASLANQNVDICLIPECPFELHGPNGLYESIIKRIKDQGHCIIVVAEGAEEGLINPNERITANIKYDGSNNQIFDDIGKFMKDAIVNYGKHKHDMSITLKYIDPTYMIRSVQANAMDTIMCAKLAQNAVHGAMNGFTAFSVGQVRNGVAFIPVKTLIEAGVNKISILDRSWQRLMSQNRQKQMLNVEYKDKAWEKILQDEQDRKQRRADIVERIQRKHQESLNSVDGKTF